MRIDEFDVAKGFAISIVVFAHAVFFNFDKFDAMTQRFVILISTFLAPALAIFFFISGFLGYRSYMKRKKFTTFEISKIKVLIPPYLAWSTIYILLQEAFGQVVGVPYHFSLISIIEKYLFGEAFLPFYYIIMLVIFYFITPFFSKLNEKDMKFWNKVLFIAGLLSVSFYLVPQYFLKQYVPPLIAYRNPFAWIFFYTWGIYMAKTNNISWRKHPSQWLIIGFVATYALSSLEMITVPKLNHDWESYLVIGPGIYVFYPFAIRFFLWVSYKLTKNHSFSVIFSSLGENSFGIYLNHGLILMGILGVFILLNKGSLEQSNFLLNSIGGLIGIFLCYGFSNFIRKMPKLVNQTLR